MLVLHTAWVVVMECCCEKVLTLEVVVWIVDEHYEEMVLMSVEIVALPRQRPG